MDWDSRSACLTRHWAGAAELSCVCGGLPKYRLGSSRWKLSVESSEADGLDLYMDLFEESSLRTLLGTAACRLVLAVARARSHQQATQRAASELGRVACRPTRYTRPTLICSLCLKT